MMDPRERPWLFADRLCRSVSKGTRLSSHLRHEGLSIAMPLASVLAHSAIKTHVPKTGVADEAWLLELLRVILRFFAKIECSEGILRRDVVFQRAVPLHVSQRAKRGRLRCTQPFPARAFSREHAREYFFDAPVSHTLVLFQEPMWTSSCHKQVKTCCYDLALRGKCGGVIHNR